MGDCWFHSLRVRQSDECCQPKFNSVGILSRLQTSRCTWTKHGYQRSRRFECWAISRYVIKHFILILRTFKIVLLFFY